MINLEPHSLETIQAILARHVPDAEVLVFGSRVKGNAKSYSDLDLAIRGDKKLSIRQLGTLREAFEESDLPIRVDVVDWHTTSPEFQNIILDHGEVLVKSIRHPAMANSDSMRDEI